MQHSQLHHGALFSLQTSETTVEIPACRSGLGACATIHTPVGMAAYRASPLGDLQVSKFCDPHRLPSGIQLCRMGSSLEDVVTRYRKGPIREASGLFCSTSWLNQERAHP